MISRLFFISNIIILISVLMIHSVLPASFPCEKAKSSMELTICGDKLLSDLDTKLNDVYKKALESTNEVDYLKGQQRSWIKYLSKKSNVDELIMEYRDRIATLESTVRASAKGRQPNGDMTIDEVALAAKSLYVYRPNGDGTKSREQDDEACSATLADLQNKKLNIIAPLTLTNDYNTRSLQEYLSLCPNLKPYKTIYYDIADAEDEVLQSKPNYVKEIYGRVHYGRSAFRLYLLPKRSDGIVVYGGHGTDVFRHYDTNNCKEVSEVGVTFGDTDSSKNVKVAVGYNQFRNETFSLQYTKSENIKSSYLVYKSFSPSGVNCIFEMK